MTMVMRREDCRVPGCSWPRLARRSARNSSEEDLIARKISSTPVCNRAAPPRSISSLLRTGFGACAAVAAKMPETIACHRYMNTAFRDESLLFVRWDYRFRFSCVIPGGFPRSLGDQKYKRSLTTKSIDNSGKKSIPTRFFRLQCVEHALKYNQSYGVKSAKLRLEYSRRTFVISSWRFPVRDSIAVQKFVTRTAFEKFIDCKTFQRRDDPRQAHH